MTGDFPDEWFRPARSTPPEPRDEAAGQERWTDQFKPNYVAPGPDVTAPTRPVRRPSLGSSASSAASAASADTPLPGPDRPVEHSVGTARTVEEFDEPEPRSRTRTVLPLVGAFLLVLGCGLGIGRYLGQPTADQENAGTQMPVAGTSVASGTATTSAPAGPWVGAVKTVAATGVKASCTAAAQPGYDGNLILSDAERVLDGDLKTGWRCEGEGTGRTLTFTFPEGTKVVGVRMTNGYTKQVEGRPLYPQYRRVSKVTWSLPSLAGAYFVQDLDTDHEAPQEIRIPEVDAQGGLTMTIDATTEPGRALATRNAVIITEVEFLVRAG
ncbi:MULTISPECIES: NADase-type glycan-binding domain-containing protein [unclassified Luteococcus]|uniref:NADase-type glycan-binding domain-containing protein n=1 Tax=unclassified Luteococcus TaxID=2639923 RepID=UPI00313E3817